MLLKVDLQKTFLLIADEASLVVYLFNGHQAPSKEFSYLKILVFFFCKVLLTLHHYLKDALFARHMKASDAQSIHMNGDKPSLKLWLMNSRGI
jgi:hypothetical protein